MKFKSTIMEQNMFVLLFITLLHIQCKFPLHPRSSIIVCQIVVKRQSGYLVGNLFFYLCILKFYGHHIKRTLFCRSVVSLLKFYKKIENCAFLYLLFSLSKYLKIPAHDAIHHLNYFTIKTF